MNDPNRESLREIEMWLDEHAEGIGRRAAARAARTVFWIRRLRRINGILSAAVVLMSAQVAWEFWLLARLQGTASSLPEIVRLTLS